MHKIKHKQLRLAMHFEMIMGRRHERKVDRKIRDDHTSQKNVHMNFHQLIF